MIIFCGAALTGPESSPNNANATTIERLGMSSPTFRQLTVANVGDERTRTRYRCPAQRRTRQVGRIHSFTPELQLRAQPLPRRCINTESVQLSPQALPTSQSPLW